MLIIVFSIPLLQESCNFAKYNTIATTMKKRISFALLLLLVATVAMVGQTRYCLSYEDFKNDKWVTLEDAVTMEERSNSQKFWPGGGDSKFTTGNKETDKLLKKKARFIIYEDKMYVNLRKLRAKGITFGSHYTTAYRYGEDKVCFVAQRPMSLQTMITGSMFGAVGGAIAASSEIGNEACYIMDSNEKKVKQIKAEDMSALLAESPLGPGLYETYDKEAKESAEVIIRQLKKIDLLKPY